MNKYYVYVHKRQDTGAVFYVGKGSGERFKRTRKYKAWLKIYNEAGGFMSEIYRAGLSEKQALELETDLIRNPLSGWELVNQVRSFTTATLTQAELLDYFNYDIKSPTCLTFKYGNRSKIKKTFRGPGDVAGYFVNKNASPLYYTVRVLSKPFLVHRIIWIMHHGEIPEGLVVNHINNNSLDNRIENLEVITQAQNCKRKKLHKDPTTGVYTMTVGKNKYEVANWTNTEGIRELKLFSHHKLGEEEAFRQATELRKTRMLELECTGYQILQN